MATLAPTGAYSGVMESQSVGEPLTRKIRKFLSEAPIRTQLMSMCFHHVPAADEQSQSFPPHQTALPAWGQKTRSCREPAQHQDPSKQLPQRREEIEAETIESLPGGFWLGCGARSASGLRGQEPLEGGHVSWLGHSCLATFFWPFSNSPSVGVSLPAVPGNIETNRQESLPITWDFMYLFSNSY